MKTIIVNSTIIDLQVDMKENIRDALAMIDEYSSLDERISSAASCMMATTFPPSPTQRRQGCCQLSSLGETGTR